MSRIKRVVMVQPASEGGNFEYVAIPRQGLLFLSGALAQWRGRYLYDREIWFEDRVGPIDPVKDLEGVDVLMVSALINEAPRAYRIAREAKLAHPDLITIGGGPHMSPLADEALREGLFDVVVNREGEDIIGPLCDVLLTYPRPRVYEHLRKIPGISYLEDGRLVQTPRIGVIPSDFVELPDWRAIKGLTPQHPMAGGVLETVRGCTEKCTYCQVIKQFLGYRMVRREVELKRIQQLRELAEDGLIYTGRDGRFSVFISDDLHPPPLRAVKFRNERLERLKGWKGHTDDMFLICQARAEVGQDPELMQAMWDAGIRMIYVGVESSNAENLKAVNKRQDPNQVHKDLTALNQFGFTVVAMTIIGLPYDTEEGIMEMADWVSQVSKYQTANWLTPLPATSNWDTLRPLDEDGSLLPPGKMRPYHLYTGRQLVHYDPRWTMAESRALFERYYARLRPVDLLYERIFRLIERRRLRQQAFGQAQARALERVLQLSETLRGLVESANKGMTEGLHQRIQQISETMRTMADPLGREVSGYVSMHLRQMSANLRNLADAARKGITDYVKWRIGQMSQTLKTLAESASTQAVGGR